MKKTIFTDIIKNEDGFLLIMSLMILTILTIIGVSTSNTTRFELTIAANDRVYNRSFYTAESAWPLGGLWLNAKAGAPSIEDTSQTFDGTEVAIVRNYGGDPGSTTNDTFPPGTEDGTLNGIPYWYRLTEEDNVRAVDFGEGYRDFKYKNESNADKITEITTMMWKVFKVGY